MFDVEICWINPKFIDSNYGFTSSCIDFCHPQMVSKFYRFTSSCSTPRINLRCRQYHGEIRAHLMLPFTIKVDTQSVWPKKNTMAKIHNHPASISFIHFLYANIVYSINTYMVFDGIWGVPYRPRRLLLLLCLIVNGLATKELHGIVWLWIVAICTLKTNKKDTCCIL